ncbi:hypothetical protein JOD03_001282 [Chryseomicrobium aureum]|uniref:hypothetical protein n=1 Tax=Chryseomicrobium aureum TaxID=1441723 RepID=UPI00195E45D6|nr:hypothetical protein [Chryseomicrobium aureum]MBM7706379.1 hypothetical protein [Chryseomicrobium aureum]
MTRLSLDSKEYRLVEKSLSLEEFKINKKIALRAIEAVNTNQRLTSNLIKAVIRDGKV